MPLIWTAEAISDLDAIHEYIARTSPRYAEIVVNRLIAAASRLADFPESGRVVPELGHPRVREVIHGAYRIVYEVRDEWLDVLTVFRGSRLFPPQAD